MRSKLEETINNLVEDVLVSADKNPEQP
jgi:hypothetical protein